MCTHNNDANSDAVVEIRAAGAQDAAAIVDIFDEAFSAKFIHAVKDTALRKQLWSEVIEFDQVTVAVRGHEVVGMILVSFADSPGFKKTSARKIVNVLGFPKAVRAALVFLLFSTLDWKPAPQHAYVEAVSVSSAARGLGVGSLLLAASKQAAKRRGVTALELSVVCENTEAKRLYLRQGFEVVHVKKSVLLSHVAGVSGADVMRLAL